MPNLYSDSLKIKKKPNRIIDALHGVDEGPTVVFFAGIHGNEPAGVLALQEVFKELKEANVSIFGSVYGLAGNLNALEKKIRYENEDLNRIWSEEKLARINKSNIIDLHQEEKEMLSLYEELIQIISNSKPPFYFIDLHTTSSRTSPFIVMNDSMLNRSFVMNYPLPKVLGIEEYLHGALLSFINEMGYVSFGFESGQHQESHAVLNNIGFINYTLALTTSIQPNAIELNTMGQKLSEMSKIPPNFFEITYEHHLSPSDQFEMIPDFENFQKIKKGAKVALYNQKDIIAKKATQIFMPLYQNQGSEGFYFIKPIPKFFLWLSKYLRNIRLDNFLTRLPGVKWQTSAKSALIVNTRVAKYISKSVFHLLGYRVRQKDVSHLVLKSRESASKHKEYPTKWS